MCWWRDQKSAAVMILWHLTKFTLNRKMMHNWFTHINVLSQINISFSWLRQKVFCFYFINMNYRVLTYLSISFFNTSIRSADRKHGIHMPLSWSSVLICSPMQVSTNRIRSAVNLNFLFRNLRQLSVPSLFLTVWMKRKPQIIQKLSIK